MKTVLFKIAGVAFVFALVLALSTVSTFADDPTPTPAAEATPESQLESPSVGDPQAMPPLTEEADTVELEIGTASEPTVFKYDQETLEAPAGSKITLTFHNNTKASDEVGHNWVLVKPGQEQAVLERASKAGDDNDWLMEDDPDVIAHTALIEGETSDTVEFEAPEPGTYTFLSTFPDQYAGGMKGTLTIK